MSEYELRSQAADIFRKAAGYIRRYGWQEEGMGSHGLPRCSMGALASAHPQPKWNSRLASLMYETLYQELQGLSLTEFNHRTRQGEAVARLYEHVAASLVPPGASRHLQSVSKSLE